MHVRILACLTGKPTTGDNDVEACLSCCMLVTIWPLCNDACLIVPGLRRGYQDHDRDASYSCMSVAGTATASGRVHSLHKKAVLC